MDFKFHFYAFTLTFAVATTVRGTEEGGMRHYRYRERISQVEDSQQKRRTQQTQARPSSNSVTPPPAATISNVQPAGSKYGEDLRFQTSVKELFPNRANYKCFLSAAMTRLAARAGVTM